MLLYKGPLAVICVSQVHQAHLYISVIVWQIKLIFTQHAANQNAVHEQLVCYSEMQVTQHAADYS